MVNEKRQIRKEIRQSRIDGMNLSLSEATSLAKSSGLRNARDRLILALFNAALDGDRIGTRWSIPRKSFELWLEGALDDDRFEDSSSLRLPEAKSLARTEGVENASDRVLQAVMCGEIENCQRDGAGWIVPKDKFQEWLEELTYIDPAEVEPSENIEQLYNLEPTASETFWAVAETWIYLGFTAACWIGLILIVIYFV